MIAKILFSLSALIIAIGVVGISYLGLQEYMKHLKHEAITSCYAAGYVTFAEVDEKTGVVTQSSRLPSNDLFKECMSHKGYTIE